MFQGIKNGWDLIKESIRVFHRYPKFLIPLLLTWTIYAPIILYLEYSFNWDIYTTSQVFLIILGVVFVFAFLLSLSCSMLLELIQQLESGQGMSVSKAFGYTLRHNSIRMLPIVFVWTIIWFVLLLIQALLSKDKKRKEGSFTTENAAKTLAGYGNFSLSRAFFAALEKGVRMVVFLILPAIAWENLSFWQSVKKGVAVFRTHLSTFAAGFVLTGLAAAIIFLPPALLFFISDELEVVFPNWVWIMTTIYIAFGWSYSIYLEQFFTAELYLWNHKWEKEVVKAQQEGRPLPTLSQVSRPSILDDVRELVAKSPLMN